MRLTELNYENHLAGVKVPSKVGAEAHSDGDAVYHR